MSIDIYVYKFIIIFSKITLIVMIITVIENQRQIKQYKLGKQMKSSDEIGERMEINIKEKRGERQSVNERNLNEINNSVI